MTTLGAFSVCKLCGKTIRKDYFNWLSIDDTVFPQYCDDEFQNQYGSQKHVPLEGDN